MGISGGEGVVIDIRLKITNNDDLFVICILYITVKYRYVICPFLAQE